MDLVSSIASASMSLSQFKVQQSVQISMLKKTMDTQEAAMTALVQDMMPSASVAPPSSGHIVDVLA